MYDHKNGNPACELILALIHIKISMSAQVGRVKTVEVATTESMVTSAAVFKVMSERNVKQVSAFQNKHDLGINI